MEPQTSYIPYQTNNPTNEERHTMFKYLLNISNRPEDFQNIFELLSPPQDILTICNKN
jgi:monoamine oxidase